MLKKVYNDSVNQPMVMKCTLLVAYAFAAFMIVSVAHIERDNIAKFIHSVAEFVSTD